MQVFFLVIAASFGAVLSGTVPETLNLPENDGANMEYFLVESSPGVYVVEDLVNAEINTMVSEEDLTYHFFSQTNPSAGVKLNSTNIEVLSSTTFSQLRNTVFLIHGWVGNNESEINDEIRETILANNNINVFVVDWSPIAARNYISAKNAVVPVGQLVANFISSLVSRYRLVLSRVALVGFSLGAHVAGNAGAVLNGEIDLIVGLDPAGPLFSVRNTYERLDPTDGQYVHVIHTNGGLLGFSNPSGHSDYYPNGGSSQPGCGLDIGGGCAHSRAVSFYAESVSTRNSQFVATQCSSNWDYRIGRCRGNPTSVLGGYPVDRSASGTHYLETNSAAPFARG